METWISTFQKLVSEPIKRRRLQFQRHGRLPRTVVLQPLGHVHSLDVCRLLERPHVQNEFMSYITYKWRRWMLNRSRFVWMTTFKNPAKYLSCLWRGFCSDLPASWPCSWRSGWPPLKHEASLWLPSSKHPIIWFKKKKNGIFYWYIFSVIYEYNSCLRPPQMIWTDLYVGPGDGQDGARAPGCSADGAQWAAGVDWLHGYHRMTREEGGKVSLTVKVKNNFPFLNKFFFFPINSNGILKSV